MFQLSARTLGIALVVSILAGLAFMLNLFGGSKPSLSISAGSAKGKRHQIAIQLKQHLAEKDLAVKLVPTAGSV